MPKKNRIALLSGALLLIAASSSGAAQDQVRIARVLSAETAEKEYLHVYNWEDYIQDDEDLNEDGDTDDEGEQGLVTQFEEYMALKGRNVTVIYDKFDTNESMLSQLQVGGRSYDLICPSDYIIQKMIREDLIQPYDEGSTPNYDKYVSPFVLNKIDSISVDGEQGIVGRYARGYMWGTLGLLYNPGFSSVEARGITPLEMQTDMHSWLSLWEDKYDNLLAIKDSMRDTYAVGIMKAYDQDFVIDGKSYEGFSTLKQKHDSGEYDDDTYNSKVSEIFNLCDDTTLERVGYELQDLRDNAYGFEVDSGKTDMAQGKKFAINVAWSGDAAFAMDQADEINEANEGQEGFEPTILKYSLPDTGANIWFDGWVIPKNAPNKKLAQEFVDFLSMPANAAINMNYIGYTPVIAGDAILDLVLSWYDLRYDEESGAIDPTFLEGLTQVDSADVDTLSDEEKESSYYTKDISYFFEGTLTEHVPTDAVFALLASEKDRQFDTQYPDRTVLPGLAVMADFGDQTDALLSMWEDVKNTTLPIWAYVLIVILVLAAIGLSVFFKVKRRNTLRRRRERKEGRQLLEKRSLYYKGLLTDQLD